MTQQSSDLPVGFTVLPAELPLLDKICDIWQHNGALTHKQVAALLRKDPTNTVRIRNNRIRLLLRYVGMRGRPTQ